MGNVIGDAHNYNKHGTHVERYVENLFVNDPVNRKRACCLGITGKVRANNLGIKMLGYDLKANRPVVAYKKIFMPNINCNFPNRDGDVVPFTNHHTDNCDVFYYDFCSNQRKMNAHMNDGELYTNLDDCNCMNSQYGPVFGVERGLDDIYYLYPQVLDSDHCTATTRKYGIIPYHDQNMRKDIPVTICHQEIKLEDTAVGGDTTVAKNKLEQRCGNLGVDKYAKEKAAPPPQQPAVVQVVVQDVAEKVPEEVTEEPGQKPFALMDFMKEKWVKDKNTVMAAGGGGTLLLIIIIGVIIYFATKKEEPQPFYYGYV